MQWGHRNIGLSGSLPSRAIDPILNHDAEGSELVADSIRGDVVSC